MFNIWHFPSIHFNQNIKCRVFSKLQIIELSYLTILVQRLAIFGDARKKRVNVKKLSENNIFRKPCSLPLGIILVSGFQFWQEMHFVRVLIQLEMFRFSNLPERNYLQFQQTILSSVKFWYVRTNMGEYLEKSKFSNAFTIRISWLLETSMQCLMIQQ